MKIFRLIGLAVFTVLMSVTFAACDDDEEVSIDSPIVGTWSNGSNDGSSSDWSEESYTFNSNGSVFFKETGSFEGKTFIEEGKGKYEVGGNRVMITWTSWKEEDESSFSSYNEYIVYKFAISDDILSLELISIDGQAQSGHITETYTRK